MKYPLTDSTWGKEEINALSQVVASGNFTMGKHVRMFEKEFATKAGTKHSLMVSSGSMANLVATASLFYRRQRPLSPGDEVIVPCISWATTYYPLQQYGLKLQFIDVDLETLNMDVTQLEKVLTPKTKMVVAVNILGNPSRLDAIREFCDQKNLILFEDNCESMGATLNEKWCGTYGDIGTFSTFYSHHISTMEGGFIVTNDDETYELCKSLRAHGWTRDLSENSPIYEPKEDDFFEAYRFILPGYNARPLELSAAAGREQLKKLDRFLSIRRQNADVFKSYFEKDERFIIQKETGKSSWFCFTIILNPKFGVPRKKVLTALAEADIGFRIITGGNFLRHEVIKYFNYDCIGGCKNANTAHDFGLFVGNFPTRIDEKIKNLYEVMDQSMQKRMSPRPIHSPSMDNSL